jgi:Arc/MetJ-type ribon-helix-helix transcriptional regulator
VKFRCGGTEISLRAYSDGLKTRVGYNPPFRTVYQFARNRPRSALHCPVALLCLHVYYHPARWFIDGEWMAKIQSVEVRRKEAESEKITINLGYVDLGHIDLLVQEGFYSNRTDFIRTAIRNQLSSHGDVLKQTVARRSMVLGLQRYTREDLERVRKAGEQLHIQVLGLASIDDDVPAKLAVQTIASISVLGALRASSAVRAALADRIR